MKITFKEIENIVTNHLGVDLDEKTRAYPYPMSRFMYFKLCKDYGPKRKGKTVTTSHKKEKKIYDPTFQSIADTLNKHHATVIHGINILNNLLEVDKSVVEEYIKLEKIVLDKINNVKNESSNIKYKNKYLQS